MPDGIALLLAFLIGGVCGLRSMTGPAVTCWAAHLGWLHVKGSHVAFTGSWIAVSVFSVCALGELVADKLPKIPRRTESGPLAVRAVAGALCGGAVAVGGGADFVTGCMLGGLGGLMGAFAGYWARKEATSEGRLPDLPVALIEDLIAVGGGLFLVSRF
jgi:uncharacterized membrane protein